jgi:hypothetical protein
MSKELIYGFPCVSNPNDFTPDMECSTPEERASHAEACKQWKDGSYMRDSKQFCESFPYDLSLPVNQVIHISRTPWGLGTSEVDWDDDDEVTA